MGNSMFVFDENKIKEQSMVDIGFEILKQSKSNYPFNELIKEIGKVKGLSEEEIMNNIAQLFTEINIDGRFVHAGQNEWGLKSWYPVDQTDSLHLLRDDDEEEDDDFDEDYIDDDEEEIDKEVDEEEEEDFDEDLADDEDDDVEDFDEEEDFDEDIVEDIAEEDDFVEDIDEDIDSIDLEEDEDIELDVIDEED